MDGIVWLWLYWSYGVHSDFIPDHYKDEGLKTTLSSGIESYGLCSIILYIISAAKILVWFKKMFQNQIRFESFYLKIKIIILIHKRKNLTLMSSTVFPPSLAHGSSPARQLIQSNYIYIIFAFVKLKDKYYFFLIK